VRLLFAFLLAFSCVTQAQHAPAWFAESLLELPDDVAAATAEGKRVMLYFGQEGCPYCKRLMEVNFRQAAIAGKAKARLVALELNIWGDREVIWTDGRKLTEKRLAAELKVQFTPTLLFLDERGAIALRLNGYLPPHEFEAALDYVLARMERTATFPEYLKKRKPPAARATLNPQPFFLASADLRRAPGGKPLALLFETPDCAQCDELHAVAFKRREVLEQLARFDVVRLAPGKDALTGPDGRKTTASGLAEALKVGYVPTLVLFERGGREVLRTEAYLRPFHVAGALEYVASGAYAGEPSFQRFLQDKAERMRARGERVDLWE
jgi:thioredoxin-related protein